MFPDFSALAASDGEGEAVRATVQSPGREVGSSIIPVNATTNWPTGTFIATMGTLQSDNTLDPTTVQVIYGTADDTNITIVGFAAGYSDLGNSTGDVVVIKPNTEYANTIAQAINAITPTGTIAAYAGVAAPANWLLCQGQAVSRTTYATLWNLVHATVGTPTVTIASPGVFTLASHGLQTGASVYLTTTGALPTGLAANTQYFVIYESANTFELATSLANAEAGTAINTSGSQSGTITLVSAPYGVGDGATTFNVPNLQGNVVVGLNASDSNFNTLGKTGGEDTHQLTVTEMPSHSHSFSLSGSATGSNTIAPLGNTTVSWSQTTNNTGGNGAHNNLQPYIAVNYIIKT